MGTGWQQGPQDCTQLTDDQLLVNGEKQPREPGKDCLKLDRKQSSRKRHLIQPRKESPSTSHRTQPRVCRPKDETHLQAPTSHKRTGSPARVGDCHEGVAMGLLELYTDWPKLSPPAPRTCLCTCVLREAPLPLLLQPALHRPTTRVRAKHPGPCTRVCVGVFLKKSGLEPFNFKTYLFSSSI